MKATRKNRTRKRRGRPATGQGLQVGTRWRDETVAMIDAWASVQEDDPGRSEGHPPRGRTRAEGKEVLMVWSMKGDRESRAGARKA